MPQSFHITYGDFEAPAGTTVSGVLVVVTDAAGAHTVQSIAPSAPSAAFDLAPGDYTCSVQAVDHAGAFIGPEVTGAFSVAAPAPVPAAPADPAPAVPATVTVQIPVSVVIE